MPDQKHGEILEQFDDDWLNDSDNRDDALEDLKFAAGDHWDDAERRQRETDGRPCLTINRMPQFVSQVANDIRQSQPSISALPVDDVSDPMIAQIYEGIIRQIEYRSKAHAVYGSTVESGIRCGIGNWRIETQFTDDSTFDQEIRIKGILDPLSVIWPSHSVQIDRSDARRCYVTDMISDADFEERFDKKPVDMPTSYRSGGDNESGIYWRRDKQVRIAEYWYTVPEKRRLVLTNEGETLDVTDWEGNAVAFLNENVGVRMERDVERPKVFRQMMDGQDWLDDPEEWAGRFIPIIPHIGSQVAFDGKVIRHGLIRWAKDPQRLYNLWRSAGAEVIGDSPKAPWLLTPGMVEGLEGHWANANRSNKPYLLWNPDENNPGREPQRQQPPTAPAAMWQESAAAADDMKSTTGIFDAALGARSNETSGRAINARDRQGDVANFHFIDNFKASMQRQGEILIDLIPKVYDASRTIRILGANNEEQFVPINKAVMSADGEPMLVNDLSHGRFDVRVDLGPSYTTARVEAQELMRDLLQSNPNLLNVFGDIFFENSDAAGAKELAERMKRVIPPEITGDEEALAAQQQAQQPEQDPVAEILTRLELEQRAADLAKTEADVEKTQADTNKALADTRAKEVDTLAGGLQHL